MLKKLLLRLKNPKSWRILLWLLAGLGIGIDPDIAEYLIGIGVLLAGLLEVIVSKSDKKLAKKREENDIALPEIDFIGKSEQSDYELSNNERVRSDAKNEAKESADSNTSWNNR